MQAFFANFPNKLALNFPQNIVRQIFHEMSNILYIFRFSSQSRFSRFSADFPVNGFSADSPQLYRIRRFSRFSADFPPDFPLYRIRQIFRTKKALRFIPECLKLWFYTVTTFVSHTVFRYSFKRSVTTFFLSSYSIS